MQNRDEYWVFVVGIGGDSMQMKYVGGGYVLDEEKEVGRSSANL